MPPQSDQRRARARSSSPLRAHLCSRLTPPSARAPAGLGHAFTAHPRPDVARGRMVGWSWASKASMDGIAAEIWEWDQQSGEAIHRTPVELKAAIAPHDFALTDDWYIFAHNAMELELAGFVSGRKGPVDCLVTTGGEVLLQLVGRPDGAAAGEQHLVHTGDPYFNIHHATAFDDSAAADGDGARALRLFTAGWPRVGKGPFLGDWGGDVPSYDDGKIAATRLFESTITLRRDGAHTVEKVAVAGGACIDHPHVDPRYDGTPSCRYVHMSLCNTPGESGSPPIGYLRYDLREGESVRWWAPHGTFCEELVVIPKEGGGGGDDEADAWLAGMMYDSTRGRSCLGIFDAAALEDGPVCRLWLKTPVPHGLHGCFSPELAHEF